MAAANLAAHDTARARRLLETALDLAQRAALPATDAMHRALANARACLQIVAANDGAALERPVGWEALGLVERAAGNATGHAEALAHARAAFTELDASDKSWCAESIDKLATH